MQLTRWSRPVGSDSEVVEYSQLPGGCMADGDCARDAMIILGVANAVDG